MPGMYFSSPANLRCARLASTSREQSQAVRLNPAILGAQLQVTIVKPVVAVQNSSARKLVVVGAVLMTICLVSLIIAGVASLISLAERIHPIAGTIVFWSVCAAAGFFALYYAIAYARLPAALVPPEEDSGSKHDALLQALRIRLAVNPPTRHMPLTTNEESENAVGHP